MIVLRDRYFSSGKMSTHKYRGRVSGGKIDRNDDAHPDEEPIEEITQYCKKKHRSRKKQEECIRDSVMSDPRIEDDVKAVNIAEGLQKLRRK